MYSQRIDTTLTEKDWVANLHGKNSKTQEKQTRLGCTRSSICCSAAIVISIDSDTDMEALDFITGEHNSTLTLAYVKCILEDVLPGKGDIDLTKFKPVARLGERINPTWSCRTTRIGVTLPRNELDESFIQRGLGENDATLSQIPRCRRPSLTLAMHPKHVPPSFMINI
ncbi:hypothetical protein P692DRAFT_20605151 [Suillus brevipes Sb2]|nr:hypothetical protein P692DRAFT_20605151 [Suillus brevipes Sb2]